MTRAKSLALAFYLGAALAGAAIGVSVDRAFFRMPQGGDPRSARSRFFGQLRLTNVQRDSATVIIDDRDSKLKALMDSNKAVLAPWRAQSESVFAESRRRLSMILTPEQKAIYDQIRRDHQQRAERR
jgi:Spy/CpxP family protein refolding chaperone